MVTVAPVNCHVTEHTINIIVHEKTASSETDGKSRPATLIRAKSIAVMPRPFLIYSESIIYIFIHQNMIERTEQKVQQKSTHKKEKKQQ